MSFGSLKANRTSLGDAFVNAETTVYDLHAFRFLSLCIEDAFVESWVLESKVDKAKKQCSVRGFGGT
jgi:DNA topoisomerase IA